MGGTGKSSGVRAGRTSSKASNPRTAATPALNQKAKRLPRWMRMLGK